MVVAIWGGVSTEARSARGNPAPWPARASSSASATAQSPVEVQAGELKTPSVASLDFKAQSAVIIDPETHQTTPLALHQRVGDWTLMAVVQLPAGDSAAGPAAVLEDAVSLKGSIEYVGVGKQGVLLTLPKSLEPTSVPPGTRFRGKTLDEIENTESDFLATDFLAGNADPSYNDVAAALPPLRVPSFVGTRHSDDKPTYDYGGFSDEIYLDVGKLFPDIRAARARHDVGEGLIGEWLPVLRFVFPAGADRQFEETILRKKLPGISGRSRCGIGYSASNPAR
jgi:hypothetical protein